MNSLTITPADVFERVNYLYLVVIWLARLVGLLCALVLLQIGAKAIIFARVNRLLERIERLTALVEKHGILNDVKASELRDQTTQAARVVSAVVKNEVGKAKVEIPLATVAEAKRSESAGNSGIIRPE